MDEGGSSQKLLELLKANILLVVISGFGVVFLIVGLVSFLHKPAEAEIEFESGENRTEADRTDKTNRTNSIFVDVSGEVAKPGLYELQPEARIADALEKAGGMTENADRDYVSQTVNLAQKLEDGSKLFIPSKTSQVLGKQTTGSGQDAYHSNSSTVNINKASVQELDKLPGIGAVRAQKIIENRPYSEKRDLVTKKVVTQKIFEEMEGMISLY